MGTKFRPLLILFPPDEVCFPPDLDNFGVEVRRDFCELVRFDENFKELGDLVVEGEVAEPVILAEPLDRQLRQRWA